MKNKKTGFTLVEVIITMALIGIVTPVIYSIFFSGQKSFKLGTEEVYQQQSHRLLRDYLTKELRYASYISNEEPGNGYKRYYGLELEDGKLIRREYGSSNEKTKTLSSFKGKEIRFISDGDLITVKYKSKENTDLGGFNLLLENSLFNVEDSTITSSNLVYYAIYEDVQKSVEDSESEKEID